MKTFLKLVATLWLFFLLVGGGMAGCVAVANAPFALGVPVGLTFVLAGAYLFHVAAKWLWRYSTKTPSDALRRMDNFWFN